MPRLSERIGQGAQPRFAEIAAYPTGLGWSAGGERLAVAGDHGIVEMLSPEGASLGRVRAHDGPVQSIAWHPRRDELITSGQDGAVRLWQPQFDHPTTLLGPGETWADAACWSSVGTRAAVAVGSRAYVLARGTDPVEIGPVESTVAGLAFSPSGKSLGVACYGGVRLFDPASGRPTRKLQWKGAMLSLAFSPDGSTVACGCQDNSVHFWRIASGNDAQMSGFPAKPRCVGFTHDGRWLVTSGDATICLWPFDKRGPEGRKPLELAGHPDLVTALACAPHVDLLLSGDRTGVVALWAPPSMTQPVSLAKLPGRVVNVAWGADGNAGVLRWAAADDGGRLLVGAL
jgi:WD40 repeat protein